MLYSVQDHTRVLFFSYQTHGGALTGLKCFWSSLLGVFNCRLELYRFSATYGKQSVNVYTIVKLGQTALF